MTSGTTEENAYSEKLREDYKGAFEEWALQVSRLQAAVATGTDAKEAEDLAAAAEVAYRDSRDRMTDDMGWTPPAITEPDNS